ncbi:MAG: N-6 DNA methylase, partial [Planctomycetia bacterium]|nr:N-6 DNA methylase [Planctomycetia bacterium]
DIHPAFQLRRYAWSAKLPLSVLTDFEEFAVYDCRIRPFKTDKASVGRVMFYTFEDYIEKWDEISGIFSKDAIYKGSFDKYVESSKRKRGTAEVDDAFLKEIETWRDLLARNIALRNTDLTQRELNFAVARTIDRIVFLRIAEDRGMEDYGQLQALQNSENVYERLVSLYRQADDKYNSGLFHFRQEKERYGTIDELTTKLTIDDKVIKSIVKNLYYPDSSYEFSVLPADILGHIYEQFLGKVIRLTAGHRAKIEEKSEVRKAGGVYYTPTYIVDYIVKNTVGELVKGKTPQQVTKLNILDPACGSGSFLIGAYQYLLDWHRDWYSTNDPEKYSRGKNPAVFKVGINDWRLTTAKRKEILLNNIYGLDIDPQAVEVSKLSLLLKVLEGESQETLNQQRKLFHERALPDLGSNIKCGNSLIGPDFYNNQQIDFLNDEERYRINVFDWEAEFPQIFAKGGFDAVIGNPPYGASLDGGKKAYLLANFSFQNYQQDTYLLFLEKSVEILIKPNGYYGMIIPNPWLTNLLQKKPRDYVTNNCKITQIVHFTFPVFKKAIVDTQILLIQKSVVNDSKILAVIVQSEIGLSNIEKSENVKIIKHSSKRWRELKGGVINIFLNSNEISLANKIKQQGEKLENRFSIRVGIKPYQKKKGKPPQTAETVKNRIFDSDTKLSSEYKQYLRGKDINRYKIAPLKKRFLKYGVWLAEPRPSARFDATSKIFIRQTGDSLIAALDSSQFLCLNNLHVLAPLFEQPYLQFFLGIINSKLMNWYYHSLNPEVGEALAEVKKTNVANLPICKIDFSNKKEKAQHDKMVNLVDRMLELNKQLPKAKTDHDPTTIQRQINATDKQIDKLVYKLYDLTEEEIKIVEGE